MFSLINLDAFLQIEPKPATKIANFSQNEPYSLDIQSCYRNILSLFNPYCEAFRNMKKIQTYSVNIRLNRLIQNDLCNTYIKIAVP